MNNIPHKILAAISHRCPNGAYLHYYYIFDEYVYDMKAYGLLLDIDIDDLLVEPMAATGDDRTRWQINLNPILLTRNWRNANS